MCIHTIGCFHPGGEDTGQQTVSSNRGQLMRLSYGEHSLARSLGTRRIIASALLEQPRPPFGAQCDNLTN